jgi:hypothetical protein
MQITFSAMGAHQTDSTLSAAQALNRPTGAEAANQVLIQALTQNVRFTLDGTTPTATVGFQLKAADPPTLIPIGAANNIKVIEETASATIQYQWGS